LNVLDCAIHEPIRIDDVKHDEEGVEALRLLVRFFSAQCSELVEEFQAAFGDRLLDQSLLPEILLVLQYELQGGGAGGMAVDFLRICEVVRVRRRAGESPIASS
jgi:hypothetical protein